MKREEAWEIWAPQDSRWSGWMKRVLFSFMSDPLPDQVAPADSGWKVAGSGDVAVVVELNGAEAVRAGIQLSRFGYRPVSLFNAAPYALEVSSATAPALVDVMSIVRAMEVNTEALGRMHLPGSAPPAFLLDAKRSEGPLFPGAGIFDNRSIVRKSDLPSAEALRAEGIRRVILIREADRVSRALSLDLYPILSSWQNDGLQIETQAYPEEWNPTRFSIRRRNVFAVVLRKLLMWLSFKTNVLGSFGRTVHSAGG